MNVYKECPSYCTDKISLFKTHKVDGEELLKCYSDVKAVPFFNSDNCHGDDFHYKSIERMNEAIKFWDDSYNNEEFVRWSVIVNETTQIIGTIEMFHRNVDDEFNHYGVLRIDLRSEFEKNEIINDILRIVNRYFYEAFQVKNIITKAIPEAEERIEALLENEFIKLDRKFMIYDNYYVREV